MEQKPFRLGNNIVHQEEQILAVPHEKENNEHETETIKSEQIP